MKEGFIDWKPNLESQQRLATIGGILREYQSDSITLTLRQLYYQLVGKGIIANPARVQATGRAAEQGAPGRPRRLGRDRGPRASRRDVPQLRLDQAMRRGGGRASGCQRWKTQPEYVELWCEKDALSSVLRRSAGAALHAHGQPRLQLQLGDVREQASASSSSATARTVMPGR
jgi:hypothetical protein